MGNHEETLIVVQLFEQKVLPSEPIKQIDLREGVVSNYYYCNYSIINLVEVESVTEMDYAPYPF